MSLTMGLEAAELTRVGGEELFSPGAESLHFFFLAWGQRSCAALASAKSGEIGILTSIEDSPLTLASVEQGLHLRVLVGPELRQLHMLHQSCTAL